MELSIQHVEVHVTSIQNARDFYVDKLGLPVLEDRPEKDLIAVRAGGVRITLFGGYEPRGKEDQMKAGTHLIFKTSDLNQTIQELESRGVEFTRGVLEAGGFIKDIRTVDPDGNTVEFAEYFIDPLA